MNNDKVVSMRGIQVPTNDPNPALVQAIKDILVDAESGRLQSFYAAGFLSDGLRMSAILDRHGNVYEVIGSIEMLKHDYINHHTERL